MAIENYTTLHSIVDAAYGSDTAASGCFKMGSTGTNKCYSTAIARTDLVIGGAGLTLSSALVPFDSTDVGNYIFLTAGAGFTTGVRRLIQSVTAGVATLNASAGTNGSTGGTGYVGGSYRTPGACAAAIGSAIYQTVYSAGAHTTTTDSNNVAGGRITLTEGSQWLGYDDSIGDNVWSSTMKPSFTRGAFTTALVTFAVNSSMRGFRFVATNNGTLLSNNFANVSLYKCWINAHRISDSGGMTFDSCYINLVGEVGGFAFSGVAGTVLMNSTLITAFPITGALVATDSYIYRNTAGALINPAISAATRWNFCQCSLITTAGSIFDGVGSNTVRNMRFKGCILHNEDLTSPDPVIRTDEEFSITLEGCAYLATVAPTHTWNSDLLPNINPVVLSVAPFTSPSTGDFSLVAGVKSELRLAEAVRPGSTVTRFGWIGAEPVAPATTGGGGGGNRSIGIGF